MLSGAERAMAAVEAARRQKNKPIADQASGHYVLYPESDHEGDDDSGMKRPGQIFDFKKMELVWSLSIYPDF